MEHGQGEYFDLGPLPRFCAHSFTLGGEPVERDGFVVGADAASAAERAWTACPQGCIVPRRRRPCPHRPAEHCLRCGRCREVCPAGRRRGAVRVGRRPACASIPVRCGRASGRMDVRKKEAAPCPSTLPLRTPAGIPRNRVACDPGRAGGVRTALAAWIEREMRRRPARRARPPGGRRQPCGNRLLAARAGRVARARTVGTPACDFSRALFSDVAFSGCDFSNADFSEANFTRCTFSSCKFTGANFSEAVLAPGRG